MIVSLAVLTTGTGSGAAAWEIRTGATPGRAKLLELGVFLQAATASDYSLGRPAAIGVTPTGPVDFLVEDPADVLASGVVQSALAWGTPPTAPTAFFRRVEFPATVGSGVIWTFPKGLTIAVSSSLVLWNNTANGAVAAYAVLDV
jgi:hypothetical protein